MATMTALVNIGAAGDSPGRGVEDMAADHRVLQRHLQGREATGSTGSGIDSRYRVQLIFGSWCNFRILV
jgi:hypothetical protein